MLLFADEVVEYMLLSAAGALECPCLLLLEGGCFDDRLSFRGIFEIFLGGDG